MRAIERFLLLILILGLCGTLAELLISGHTEDPFQWTPIILIGLSFVGLAWSEAGPSGASARTLRVILVLFLVSGVVGTALHWRGKMEFQAESNPTLSGWALFRKAMDTKTPPPLAPGVMVQLGLLGFAYLAAGKSHDKKETS